MNKNRFLGQMIGYKEHFFSMPSMMSSHTKPMYFLPQPLRIFFQGQLSILSCRKN